LWLAPLKCGSLVQDMAPAASHSAVGAPWGKPPIGSSKFARRHLRGWTCVVCRTRNPVFVHCLQTPAIQGPDPAKSPKNFKHAATEWLARGRGAALNLVLDAVPMTANISRRAALTDQLAPPRTIGLDHQVRVLASKQLHPKVAGEKQAMPSPHLAHSHRGACRIVTPRFGEDLCHQLFP